MKRFMWWIRSAMVVGLCGSISIPVYAEESANSSGISSIFAGKAGEVVGFDEVQHAVRFFSMRAGVLKELKSVSVDGAVHEIIPYPQGYLVATGVGRLDRDAPIRVYSISSTQEKAELLFEKATSRAEVTGLRYCRDKVWLDFFNSKYFTSIGYLSKTSGLKYDFSEVLSIRMGSSFDCLEDTIVIGRSYGDAQGTDGDLILYQNGKQTLLPSYRGVRGVKLIGDGNNPQIIIGDGWHSNYGKIAQGRISLLAREDSHRRFHLELIEKSDTNYNFTKFIPYESKGKRFVIALGNRDIIVLPVDDAGDARTIYTQKKADRIMDMALVDVSTSSVTIAILDGSLEVRQVEFP
jgi:hypothetical protein